MKTSTTQLRVPDCEKAIKQTLLYAHIFNYPLKHSELWYYLKTSVKINKRDFNHMIHFMPKGIESSYGYYYLAGNKNIVAERKKREVISMRKLSIAKKAGTLLSIIPTILYIGISGSLSMKYAKESDDIDFFIITRKNSLWVTRLLSLLLLEMFGLRRSKSSKNSQDKVCINMLIDETKLTFSENRRDVYTSHEISQLKTLYSRNDTALKFYHANVWIKSFMPNVLPNIKLVKMFRKNPRELLLRMYRAVGIIFLPLVSLEKLTQKAQLCSIRKDQTSEVVTQSFVAFHPFDYREYVLEKYKVLLTANSLIYPFTL